MRKSIFAAYYYSRRYAPPSPPPPPSIHIHHLYSQNTSLSYHFHPISQASDSAILSVIAVVLLLSLVSLLCIFRLRRKSRASLHLRGFNNLWPVRLLLVVFVSGWAVNEILRLPSIRHRFLSFFFTSLTFSKQDDHLCKLQVVLSLGFLEPGFLVTLLYLINVSIQHRNPSKKWCPSVLMVVVMSLPPLILQIIFLFFTPFKEQLPWLMTRASFISVDGFGMICTYPLLSCILFCGFAIVYSMGLLVACWQVASMVINKAIRVRINMLGLTVMMALLIQTLFLGAESLWVPEDTGFGGVSLGLLVSVAVCAAVGEIVLVIKPIMEALETGSHRSSQLQQAADGGSGRQRDHCQMLIEGHCGSFSS